MGLEIALDGDAPTGLVFVSDGSMVRQGFAHALRHRCPLVLYLWDLKPWQMDGGKPDWVVRVGTRVQKIPRLVGGYPERPGYHSRLRYIARRADAVWCPSQDAGHELRTRFGIEVEEIPFCYDSDRFRLAPGERHRPAGLRPIVLSVSRLVAYKNHAAVLRAAARLDGDPLVHLIGHGPQAGRLLRLARDLDVELRLDEGWQTEEQMVQAYRAASVVVCPSRFEGFGLTPMEGIAMGVPVVASDIPPHREFLGAVARLVPLEDDDALVAAIEAALREGPPPPFGPGGPLPELTIEACARRLHQPLRRILEEGIAPRGFEPR
jgi:glycosyltransferase involved in cell wall biosynthesis